MATSPSFFRILKGAEKKNDLKQSVMLDSQQSGLVIQEGTIYVTTDDGNMYIDVSPTKRIKIGALADKALQAEKDYNGNTIARYFNEASLIKTTADNQIIFQRGTTINPVILSLTGATTTTAGLMTTDAQTLAGNKTFTGKINIQGDAASQPLQVRGIVGSDGTTTVSDLYLQYKANKIICLGNDGKYSISADGGQYSGNAATATKAVNDNNNSPITDYIKNVTYSVATTGDKVSFNFQRGSSNVFIHSITGATTAAAGLVTTGAQTFKGIKTFSSGTEMGVSTWISWPDSGKYVANKANETYPYDCGGLKWAEQSDTISLYAQATKRNNLDLVLNFGDDNTNSFRITDKEKTTTITMTATGDITASNFYGLASKAKADENGNQLTKMYIASLKYEAQTNTTDATNLPSIKGIAMDGTTIISTIPLPSASTGNNGFVSTTAQTFGGDKTFKNNLAVTGNTTLSGTLGVTGKTTLSGALDVIGATTLNNTLNVSKATTLNSTLGVTGATTLTGNLTANGSVTMAQSLTISGIINSLVEKSAPFVVKSNIKVTNLNADKVDGYDVTNNDFSTAKDTDMSIPSVGAVIKTFLPLLQSIQGLRYRGSVDLTQTTDDGRFGKDVLGTVKVGDVFMISKGGAYAGIYLEPADMLVCVAKSGSAITWNYIQSNINGAVTIEGATEGSKDGTNLLVSVDSIPVFSAATGRQITGSKIFIDGTGHLLPASGNTQQCLGSDTRKWKEIYGVTGSFDILLVNGNNAESVFANLITANYGTKASGMTLLWNLKNILGTPISQTSITIPDATSKTAGLLSTLSQVISGDKSFLGITKFYGNVGIDKNVVVKGGSGSDITITYDSKKGTSQLYYQSLQSINAFETDPEVSDVAIYSLIGIPDEDPVDYSPRMISGCYYDASDDSLNVNMLNGTASEANKLNVGTVGSTINPVYFKDGKPYSTSLDTVYLKKANVNGFPKTLLHGTKDTAAATNGTRVTVTDSTDTETLANGKIIYMQLDETPTSSAAIQINYNNSGYKPVYDVKGAALNYYYARKGWKLLLMYNANSTVSGGVWECISTPETLYPVNTYVTSSTSKYPICLTSSTGNSVTSSLYKNANVCVIPSTGKITANLLEINGLTDDTTNSRIIINTGSTTLNTVPLIEINEDISGNSNFKIYAGYNNQQNTLSISSNNRTNYFEFLGGALQEIMTNMEIYSTAKITGKTVYGAVWNDYAEYRKSNCKIPGKCIIEIGDDTLKLSTKRLQPGAEIISDTFGFAIGETEECKTPIAVSGRVLAYPYEPLEKFRENIGKPVCSGPNGTVSIMTDEEYQKFGYCAIGTISAIPDYEVWGSGNAKVNGRVWIKV